MDKYVVEYRGVVYSVYVSEDELDTQCQPPYRDVLIDEVIDANTQVVIEPDDALMQALKVLVLEELNDENLD